MKLLVKIILNISAIFLLQGITAQNNSIPIYYTPVKMPGVNPPYYALFDTKLLAEDLAALLQQATRQQFSVLPYQKETGKAKGIFLLLDSNATYSSNETGSLESDGKSFVRIKAKYTTGISYAMYSWLEQLGFKFYLPGDEWTIVPLLNTPFNKSITKNIYKPYFRLRMFGASGGIFAVKGLDETSENEKEWKLWYRRNRAGCDYISVDGHIGELFNIVHKKEIEADPMILAPVNGKRQYHEEGKLDPTYKKGVDMFSSWIVDEAKKFLEKMPAFLPLKKYFSVDAGDGLNYCHTAECESQYRSVSDQVFSIINETARKIRQMDPRIGVSTLAYTERADTPSIRIEPNVQVMVVPTAFQSVSTSTELMQRWSKKTKNISQYDFLNIGVWAYDMPFFNLYQYHNNLKFLQSLGIEGMDFEVSLSKFSSGVLQYFILQFLCDPYSSIDDKLNRFCTDNFGKAAMPVKKLLKEWYFSNTHLQTGFDRNTFYEDELGRFVQYITEAENTTGIDEAAKKRIEELKAYTIYLCKYYETFSDLKSLKAYAANPGLKSEKAEDMLTYTWQMYRSKIFHNTQLNDMLKQFVSEDKRKSWDYRNSERYKGIADNASAVIKREFDIIKKRYLPAATQNYTVTDVFLAANVKYSADSIHISSIDETSFGDYSFTLEFYAEGAGSLKIAYNAGSSKTSKEKKNKIAIIGVQSAGYGFIKNDFVYKENSKGILTYRLPSKGRYKLYLSQYNATHIDYVIYPGKTLFYVNKRALLSNGMKLQDDAEKNFYPNKRLAFIKPASDSIFFSNIYWNSSNTIKLFDDQGKSIQVNNSRQPLLNTAAVSSGTKTNFIFFENTVFRWSMLLNNTAPYYFFLKYPIK